MFRQIRYIGMLIVFLSAAVSADGRDSVVVNTLYHNVGVEFSAGYNLPTHGYYNGYNPLNKPLFVNSLAHLKYGFGYQPHTRPGSLYPNVTQGIGLAGCTFYTHKLMGTPVLAYIYQNAQLHQFGDDLSLDYAWELGGSYGWKKTDLIATSANVYINVGLKISYDVSEYFTLNVGPEFTHFSNGDTKYPNGGANLFNLKVGVIGHVVPMQSETDRRAIDEYESELKNKSFAERMEYDLVLFGGWRSGKYVGKRSYVINEPFPFFGLNFMPMYRLNRHFSAGLSLDLLADRSANLYDVVYDSDIKEVISYSQPELKEQVAAGLSLKGDITMPVFTVGVGVGGFVVPAGNSLRGIYSTFSLKTFVTEKLFLNISYRLSTRNYTHNLMYGMGIRF